MIPRIDKADKGNVDLCCDCQSPVNHLSIRLISGLQVFHGLLMRRDATGPVEMIRAQEGVRVLWAGVGVRYANSEVVANCVQNAS